MSNTISLYACGGAGINLVAPLNKHRGKTTPGFATFETFFLDTSRSNLRHGIEEDHIYHLEGLDGSGKRREANYPAIAEHAKEMLHRFKPSGINVVVHSASGGSGSVIGPVLVSELLARKLPTIVVLVGSSDSRIEADNTAKTLKSYEAISQKRGVPVISLYYENSKETPQGAVDQKVQSALVLLSAFFSGENHRLDTEDLSNWLNYPVVTAFSPKLSALDFFSADISLGKNQAVISVATLTDDKTDSSLANMPDYQTVGIVNENARADITSPLPIHAAIISGFFHETVQRLEAQVKAVDEARRASVEKPLLNAGVQSTDEGLVF